MGQAHPGGQGGGAVEDVESIFHGDGVGQQDVAVRDVQPDAPHGRVA
ncbi:hypothetical protein [Nonomuraea sp. NPDC049400]